MRSDLFVGSTASRSQLVLGVAVLAVLGGVVVSSSIGPWCPVGWTRIDDRCISLQRRPRTAIEAARHCEDEEDGRLVSLDGEALAVQLGAYLILADPTRSVWVTSGRRRANSTDSFEWLSSGQRLTYDLWVPDYDREDIAGRDVIALTHIDGQYKLTTVPSTDKHSFICETTPIGARLFAHRQSFLTSGAAPIILRGPHDVFHYQDYLPDKLIVLQCKAIGTPTPLIRWFKSGVELSLSRAVIATGSLALNISGASDYDSYHCTASNNLGTARSVSASVRVGFVGNFALSRLDMFTVEGSGAKIDCHEPDHYPSEQNISVFMKNASNMLQ
uniref:Uncharacterized protein n=1 Tax=Plectus sambesii TaxID=2011161 RepID=A0A914XMJ2_9BILA